MFCHAHLHYRCKLNKYLFLIFYCSVSVHAQIGVTETLSDSITEDSAVIYDFPQEKAQFPGGDEKMYQFLMDSMNTRNMTVSQDSLRTLQMKAYLSFVVWTDGEIRDVEVLNGHGDAFETELMRVVRMMPKWKPAKHNGKVVPFRLVLPIHIHTRH